MVLVRRSSSIGRHLMHIGFKVKYCHKVFEDPLVELICKDVFHITAKELNADIQELGFDKDHVHMIVDIGLLSLPEVAKYFKGRSTTALFRAFPWLKKKYFWGLGLWNPSYFYDSLGNNENKIRKYVREQGIQMKLTAY